MFNYREQNGCHNCRRCLVVVPSHDEGVSYYCKADGTVPPRMSGGLLKEKNQKLLTEHLLARLEWEDKHKVNPFGICDMYLKETKLDDC